MEVQALHFVLSDAHHGVLDAAAGRPSGRVDGKGAQEFLTELVERVNAAKAAFDRGDFAEASRQFDSRVTVTT